MVMVVVSVTSRALEILLQRRKILLCSVEVSGLEIVTQALKVLLQRVLST
jgi:hypothetical protein